MNYDNMRASVIDFEVTSFSYTTFRISLDGPTVPTVQPQALLHLVKCLDFQEITQKIKDQTLMGLWALQVVDILQSPFRMGI